MTDREETFAKVAQLIEPFNKKDVALTDETTFAGDLEWDSLIVMDFVASVSSTCFLLKGSMSCSTLANVSSLSVIPAPYVRRAGLPRD